MEESSEKRRKRLLAMREEAMAAGKREVEEEEHRQGLEGGDGTSTPILSLHSGDEQHQASSSPARFEFYTDPVGAFTGSRKKKFGGSLSPCPRSFGGNSAAYQASRPSFSTPQQSPLWQPNFYSAVTTPPCSYNAASPGYDPGLGFGSPHPSPASHSYHSSGFYPSSLSSHSPVTSAAQSFSGSETHDDDSRARSYGSSPGVPGSFWAKGSNRGSGGRGSPAGNRDNRGLGRSGSRNYQRPFRTENVFARDRPDLFVKKSMIIDPWKDLVPVRLDSATFRMDNCAEPSTTEEWMPKSIHAKRPKPPELKINPDSSGPSLAESLAASLADAVSGYN